MIIIVALLFFLSGVWIILFIDILYFAKRFVRLDKTPGLSLTSNLKYNEFVYSSLFIICTFFLFLKGYNLNNYINSLYLRFEVKDKPGVLSQITNRLAKYKISIKRIIQTPDKKNNKATIVIISHKTTELNCNNCLSIFKNNKNILKNPTLIRLLD